MSAPALPAAWILAGGLGTRLAAAVPDRPKALAPVGGRPFLDVLLDRLLGAGFERALLLLGVRHQAILEFLDERRARRGGGRDLEIEVAIEPAPLGTGGALRNARAHAGAAFFVLNGDTHVELDARAMLERHQQSGALMTMAAVEQADCRRFGRIDVTADGFLGGFREKSDSAGAGWINAGVYLMGPEVLSFIADDRPVSLESEVFPRLLAEGRRIAVAKQRGAFFDIGTPETLRALDALVRGLPGESTTPSKEVSP